MNDFQILNAMQHTLYCIAVGVCIFTVPTLILGVVLSILQAATQINEMTITFIPKFIMMFIMVFTLSPWLMGKLIGITRGLLLNLSNYIQ